MTMEQQTVVRRKPRETSSEEKSADYYYNKSKEELLEFVNTQLELMNENLLFKGQDTPGFYELQQSLMDYESVLLGLLVIHAEVRSDLDIVQEEYDNFYADKYVELKREQAALGKSATFTAQREMELYVRHKYMSEFAKYKANIIRLENSYNTINKLISGWEKYSFILNQLGANSRAEATAAGVAYKNPKEFEDDNSILE